MIVKNVVSSRILYIRSKRNLWTRQNKNKLVHVLQTPKLKNGGGDIKEVRLNKSSKNNSTSDQHASLRFGDTDRKVIIAGISLGLATVGSLAYPPLSLLSIPGLLYASQDIFRSGYQSIVKKGQPNVDVPIAILTVFCIANGYWFLSNLNIFFGMFNRSLIIRVRNDSKGKLINVFNFQSRNIWILCDGEEVEIPLDDLEAGDIFVVNAGETILADGHITTGMASVDQHIMTGEAQPVEKEAGEQVFALTVVLSGKIYVQAERTGQQTSAAQIGEILNRTVSHKTNMQLSIEEMNNRTVLPVLLLSGVSWPFLGLSTAMAVLNSHMRYKPTMTTYIGILKFFKKASDKGILIKDGRTPELMTQVDTVVFDKTGTLTVGQPHIGQVHTYGAYEEDDILTLAAAAEYRQTHPISKAILEKAAQRKLNIPEIEAANYKVGYGLIVSFENKVVRVGSYRFMEIERIVIPPQVEQTQAFCHSQGHTLVLVALNNQVIGAIELHATIRPEAREVIQGLKKRQIKFIYIISGDHEAPTKRLAEELGIDHYFAGVLPQSKAHIVEELQEQGKTVCYIGDGINDAIALKKACVSISLSGASTMALDAAQIVFMDESLSQLCYLIDSAREFDSKVKSSFVMIAVPSLISVAGALFLHFGLLQSILLTQFGMVIGLGNILLPSLRHLREE